MTFCGHWCGLPIKLLHLEPLKHVLDIFGLINKNSFPQLLDFKTKEELHLPIIDISNLPFVSFENSVLKALLVELKIISSIYSCHMKRYSLTLLVKRVGSFSQLQTHGLPTTL
jgi:hypothetical protein